MSFMIDNYFNINPVVNHARAGESAPATSYPGELALSLERLNQAVSLPPTTLEQEPFGGVNPELDEGFSTGASSCDFVPGRAVSLPRAVVQRASSPSPSVTYPATKGRTAGHIEGLRHQVTGSSLKR